MKRRTTDTDEVHALVTFGSTPLNEKIQANKKTKGTAASDAMVQRQLFVGGDGEGNNQQQQPTTTTEEEEPTVKEKLI